MTACSPQGCAGCAVGQLHKLGLATNTWDHVVALAGNPNTGKSTIFNALTGLRQHTGNWPGKTVSRAEGGFRSGESSFKLVDLPGTYSLLSATPDEEVARDFILFGRPDVTVIVADASRLERNLNLTLQVLQITNRAVLCLNLMDEALACGLHIDHRGLARDLGIPVVPASARSGQGIPELVREISAMARGETVCSPHRAEIRQPALRTAVEQLIQQLDKLFPEVPHKTWIALRLLEGDRRIMEAVRTGELGQLAGDHAAATASS